MEKQTAGRDALSDFAPKFAELNDDVLFGEVWARENLLSAKLRSIVTVSALIGKGIVDSSLKYHLETAKKHGVTKTEMSELLTHIAFYAGWPNAWAAFRMAKEVYEDECTEEHGGFFGQGEPNDAYAQYFIGQSYLKPLTDPKKTVFIMQMACANGMQNAAKLHSHLTVQQKNETVPSMIQSPKGLIPNGASPSAMNTIAIFKNKPCSGLFTG